MGGRGLGEEKGQGIDWEGFCFGQVTAQHVAHQGDSHWFGSRIEGLPPVGDGGSVVLGPAGKLTCLLRQVPNAQERRGVLFRPVSRSLRLSNNPGERCIGFGLAPGQFRSQLFFMGLELANDFLAEEVGGLRRSGRVVRQQCPRLPLNERGRHMEPLDIKIQVRERGLVDVIEKAGGERRQVDVLDQDVLPADLVDQEIDRP